LDKVSYTYNTRFENQQGTNPEELIAAAHAGCFTMKLSFLIGEAGFTPDVIETTAIVIMQNSAITGSHLIVKARVPGMSKSQFEKCAEDARVKCPVSKVLNATITMQCVLHDAITVPQGK
ncbi:MAG: OsmC family peroxiredoxin, partial [Bacteroidia bacterium]